MVLVCAESSQNLTIGFLMVNLAVYQISAHWGTPLASKRQLWYTDLSLVICKGAHDLAIGLLTAKDIYIPIFSLCRHSNGLAEALVVH